LQPLAKWRKLGKQRRVQEKGRYYYQLREQAKLKQKREQAKLGTHTIHHRAKLQRDGTADSRQQTAEPRARGQGE
jgi:hypothetical protein